jgi:hypothetical protein
MVHFYLCGSPKVAKVSTTSTVVCCYCWRLRNFFCLYGAVTNASFMQGIIKGEVSLNH